MLPPRYCLRTLLVVIAVCAVGLALVRAILPRHEPTPLFMWHQVTASVHEFTLEDVWAELTDENIICWSDYDQALAHYGLDAIPKLIEGLDDERIHVRASCVNALWLVARQYAEKSDAAIPALLKATEDENEGIRKTALG